jgi:uncharacterized protein (DUF2267 family)
MHHFDKMNQDAEVWVKEMMGELQCLDGDKALHALRAGLQALRDRLSVEEAAQLSAQLPTIIRGLFFAGWDPTGKPLRIRHRRDYLALVREKSGRDDFSAEDVAIGVIRVLERHVSAGELTDVMLSLPHDVVEAIAPNRF